MRIACCLVGFPLTIFGFSASEKPTTEGLARKILRTLADINGGWYLGIIASPVGLLRDAPCSCQGTSHYISAIHAALPDPAPPIRVRGKVWDLGNSRTGRASTG